MYNKDTLVINLIAGPCSGKSTVSAELFARLKKMNVSCELVPEYIKDRIYEENNTITKDQIALFGMEHYGLTTKLGKVKVIIHDGSFLNNIIYNNENNPELEQLVISEYFKFNNLDFFIKRGNIEFQTYGRIHNLQQSLALDDNIKSVYKKCGVKYIEVDAGDAVDKMIPIILEKLKEIE
jgi:hypothetical protein